MPLALRLPNKRFTQLKKAELANLARHLGLQTGGTTFDLRSRIRDCLDHNQRLLDEAQLNTLFPNRRCAKTNQQPPDSPHPRPRTHAAYTSDSSAVDAQQTSCAGRGRPDIDIGRAAVGGTLNDSASQPAYIPPLVTPPDIHYHPANTRMPRPPIAGPSTNGPQVTNLDPLVVPRHLQTPVTPSQPVQGLMEHPHSPMLHSQDRGKGMFNQASNFIMSGAPMFIDNNANNANIQINSSDNFMANLLQKTIIGAEFDSSARDPPPRCHPKTRLTILTRCVAFIVNCIGTKKVRWVVGAAGVGKSAIMQSVAERIISAMCLCASIFFSVNGRSDGLKAIVTLAYQLAVQCEPYRLFIRQEIAHDPSLLQKSMSVQFDRFIVKPFIHHPQLNSIGRVLILIDGLDECDNTRIQRELLRLISDLCLTHPSSPIVWMIASRPEHHITSFFARPHVEAAYEKEEIVVDSDEAREDVERHLRTELKTIQDEFDLRPQAQWPSEEDFWKLANAAGGLFVYAQTALKYIGDPDIGDPTGQLKDVLHVIDTHSLTDVPREKHPMALLDALYARILSKVPARVEQTARKLLLALVNDPLDINRDGRKFIVLCNWLGITSDEAYAALRPLSSVLYFPSHDEAHVEQLRSFHKSFLDYISDSRSVFFPSGLDNMKRDAEQLYYQCALRVFEQAPDGIDVGDLHYGVNGFGAIGTLARGPSRGDNISLTWPVDEQSGWDNNKTKLYIYKLAFTYIGMGVLYRDQLFNNMFYIRLLATRFESFTALYPQGVFGSAFDEFCDEFTEQGLLQKIPIKVLSTSDVVFRVDLRFRRPTTTNTSLLDPWNPSCKHLQEGEWGEGKDHDWKTRYDSDPEGYWSCDFCHQRFKNQLASWQARLPDHPVPVLFTSGGIGIVKPQFIDPEDGISEWTYWLCHKFNKEERMKLGSPV